jgi:hypothetical protein
MKYYKNNNKLEEMRNEMIQLSKKRSQSKRAIREYISYALNDVYPCLNEDEKVKLLTTINEISDGKLFVEVNNIILFLV